MAEKKRSITALIKSGKHKRFKNLDYDFLEEGDRIARGDTGMDDEPEEASNRATERGAKKAKRVGAESAPSAKAVPVSPRTVGTKTAVGAESEPVSRQRVGAKSAVGTKAVPAPRSVGTETAVGTKSEPLPFQRVGAKSAASTRSAPTTEADIGAETAVGTKAVPGSVAPVSAKAGLGTEVAPSTGSLSPVEFRVGTEAVSTKPSVRVGSGSELGAELAPDADSVMIVTKAARPNEKVGTESVPSIGSVPVFSDGKSANSDREFRSDEGLRAPAGRADSAADAGSETDPSAETELGAKRVPRGHIVQAASLDVGAMAVPTAKSYGQGDVGSVWEPSANSAPISQNAIEHLAEKGSSSVGLGAKAAPSTKTEIVTKSELGAESAPSRNGRTVGVRAGSSERYPAEVELLLVPRCLMTQLASEDLSPREMRIFLVIALECLVNESGVAEISGNDLQARAGVHRSHVFSALKTIVERGLVLKEKQDSAGKNLYRLNLAYFQTTSGVT